MKKYPKLSRGILIFFVSLLSFTIILLVIHIFGYRRWLAEEFQNETSKVCVFDLDETVEYEIIVEEKVEEFILSDTRTDFMTLSVEEILYVFSLNIETRDPFEIEDICLISRRGSWLVYLQYRVGSVNLPWVVMDIVKDNRETAELYVNEIRIGDGNIPNFIENRVMVDINRGISDAVIMLNENRFLGRIIENIELLDDRVVFKGSI